MKTYTLTTTLSGVLTDDYLYFEGVFRPQAFYMLKDEPIQVPKEKIVELERYFNDLYNLFLRKLTVFASSTLTYDEEIKLQALLQELIKIRHLIENDEKVAIM